MPFTNALTLHLFLFERSSVEKQRRIHSKRPPQILSRGFSFKDSNIRGIETQPSSHNQTKLLDDWHAKHYDNRFNRLQRQASQKFGLPQNRSPSSQSSEAPRSRGKVMCANSSSRAARDIRKHRKTYGAIGLHRMETGSN